MAVALAVILIQLLQLQKSAESAVLTRTGTHFIVFIPAVNRNSSHSASASESLTACPSGNIKPMDPIDEGFFVNAVPSRPFCSSLVQEVRNRPSVLDAAAYLMFRFKDERTGRLYTVAGFDPEGGLAVKTTSCSAADIISGRFFTSKDRNVALLEEAYARYRGISSGSNLVIAGLPFTVIGVVNSGIRPGKSDIYLPMNDMVRVVNRRVTIPLTNQINAILVEAKSPRLHQKAIDTVKLIVGGGVISSYNCFKPAAQVLGINEKSIWLLILIIAIAAFALSLKTQSAVVVERSHDIAVLKVIGWRNSEIVLQIVMESTIQAFLGGLCGLAAALIALSAIPQSVQSSPFFSWPIGGGIFLLALSGGIIAGLLPSLKAVRRLPAEGLQK